jgi:AmmeMemoRadiSam system protein A
MFPCEVLMAMLPAQAHGTLLKYATSAEVTNDSDKPNSVSYLAVAYSGAEWPEAPGAVRPANEVVKLSGMEKMSLLQLATETIVACVQRKKQKSAEELGIQITDGMKECFGVFVTINKKAQQGGEKELRGCIGSIYPSKQLYKSVQENAISSCSRDHRFLPVSVAELSQIEIELSILTPPRRVASYNDIVVGRDGVILAKGGRQSVFLPHVATEWGWNLEEMLTQLSLKAGLGPDDWRNGAKFDVFQAEKVG